MADTDQINAAAGGLRFYPQRDRLLAEAHARPSTPLPGPALATRIAALSGADAGERDLAHMTALCRRLGMPEPGPAARWSVLDAGNWRLRWERHTEISTWTFYRSLADDYLPKADETALLNVPAEWLAGIPGDVLAATHVSLTRQRVASAGRDDEEIGADLAEGAAQVFTDFRPGADGFTRFAVVQAEPDGLLAGRIVQQIFEIETYRLLALLAFPLAGESAPILSRLENEAAEAAKGVANDGDLDSDRALINRLAALAGEAQTLAGRNGFRFSAARAYYGLVLERIQQLRERRLGARPTIAEFMERRLAPAMRTCAAITDRQENVIAHIARTTQLLSTRADVAAEVTNAGLLASMDRRARIQLRLQQTVEGLSIAAISYYLVGLVGYAVKALKAFDHDIDSDIATGLAVPVVLFIVWLALRRMRRHLLADEQAGRS